ncbi:MAG TPA: DUF5050 domain-containing protein [Lachnospiraceae bacterium]|nr:DUF5050 domain-containing protein [Lachnospiraceae bacterium]
MIRGVVFNFTRFINFIIANIESYDKRSGGIIIQKGTRKRIFTFILVVIMLIPFNLFGAGFDSNTMIYAAEVEESNLLVGDGTSCCDGEYIYYTELSEVYRLSLKTKKSEKVVSLKESNGIYGMSIHGEDIICTYDAFYGTDGNDYYIYKLSKDGNVVTKMTRGHSPSVLNDYIYYIKTKKITQEYGVYSKSLGIYRMKLDGSDDTCILKGNFYRCVAYGDKIYFSTEKEFCQMDIDGANQVALTDETFTWKGIGNDYVYWYDYITSSICRKNVTTLKKSTVVKDTEFAFTIDRELIYYYKNGYLYKANLNGKGSTKLLKIAGVVDVKVYGDYLYVTTTDYGNNFYYLVDKDGKHKKLVRKEALAG